MQDKLLVFSCPKIKQPEIDVVIAVQDLGWLGTGSKTQQLEADITAYKGVPSLAALNSRTARLNLACVALKLETLTNQIVLAMNLRFNHEKSLGNCFNI